ncbi:uncharacterized protein LOC111519866 [Drosophila willistoni]|uniref:uncharacterized protein LOC111519866 n=1 Tax=Drosophila willistoni TaxID=7260 RepID=UPI000C26D9A7|nr:uncharacterized protein LOC111519866 [Drosophila willistoni]
MAFLISWSILTIYLVLNSIGLSICDLETENGNGSAVNFPDLNIDEMVAFLKSAITNISTYLDVTFTAKPSNCLQVQCRFTCFNGRQNQIVDDITNAMAKTNNTEACQVIDELRLYSYDFPDATIPVGFLSTYGDRVKNLYIGISNVSKIEDGAFGGGIFSRITLEDLELEEIGKGFFADISSYFKSLTIRQHDVRLSCIYPDFMDNVKYQIEYLGLQIGMEYLKYLDISHNKLVTISKNIFGHRDISRDLHIFANDNFWHCDCELVQEMNTIFAYHSAVVLPCRTPEEYKDWSVFDTRICDGGDDSPTINPTIQSTTIKEETTTITTTTSTTTSSSMWIPTLPTSGTPSPNEVITLECSSSTNNRALSRTSQNIWWPHVEFYPKLFGQLTVKVTVKSYDEDDDTTYGLFWFSKTTKEYYMMEIMPAEFGLGCYFTMPLQTIVTELVPNVAYTFCLVDSQQTNVSPFSCKSVHVGSNLETYYNTWITSNVSSKGISLMILGVVFFTFLGMITVFLILRHKPVWLKGSKRVMKPKCSSGQIVVLPRGNTVDKLKRKENVISHCKTNRTFSCISRQNSSESLASSGSYMNANLYEVIPAYMTFEEFAPPVTAMDSSFEIYDTCTWKAPLEEPSDVRYAQIPPRTKRISSDPLPAIPTDVTEGPLSVRGLENANHKVNELITLL